MKNYYKYDRHESEWGAFLGDEDNVRLGESWFANDTLDSWRHARMRAPLKAFIDSDENATWLTVGDGRFGTDGHALIEMGAKEVHCSDISDLLLKTAHERGFIKEYSKQNAENLTFPDDAFDYVYCKESFHHFPRPYIALYEMFRVARKAVVLTEPRDGLVDREHFHFILTLIKRILGKDIRQHHFEPVGNYVYSISEREMEKFLLGMHYNFIAYHSINDAYDKGVEYVKFKSKTAGDRMINLRIRLKIFIQDVLVKLKVMKPRLLSVALFKETPNQACIAQMVNNGWVVRNLPSNPYLDEIN